jgi:putative transcriptional regulator
MTKVEQTEGYLEGKILIAMPNMADPRFSRSVIFLCAHNAEGAMGLVVNKHLESLSFGELLSQLEIRPNEAVVEHRVHFGGPVEAGRGFVLHSDDYTQDGTLKIGSGIARRISVVAVSAIAKGSGPRHALMALGYAGWGPGQLESEIHDNAWLHANPDASIVFDDDLGAKWERAMAKLGIGLNNLSGASGHA